MDKNYQIRKARANEHRRLTQISFESKKYWGYPLEYFDIWKDELIISEKYIDSNIVYVYCIDEIVAAYYSIVFVESNFWASDVFVSSGYWLEHMFVLPEYIGKGIGKKLFLHSCNYCKENDIDELKIFVDQNAKGFYEKMGAKFKCEYPSSIKGRTVDLFSVYINK